MWSMNNYSADMLADLIKTISNNYNSAEDIEPRAPP
jgi:hypothetical protein